MLDQHLQQQRGTAIVHIDVVIDLIHALTDADRRGKVIDVRNADKRFAHRLAITNVAHLAFNVRVQVRRERCIGPVHLLVQ